MANPASRRKVVIVGGGVMGSASAYFLGAMAASEHDIVVIERDPTYAKASSALSASGMRQQFSTPANIDLAAYGAAFLRRASRELAFDGEAFDVGFRENGYLMLSGRDGSAAMRQNHGVQSTRGARNVLLDPPELTDRFPWLSGDGVALASLGVAGEGWFDGYSLMTGLARKAKSSGCRYVNADARRFVVERGQLVGVELADGAVIPGDVFVLAAGCWSAALAATVGIDLPVRARLRNVFSFACRSPLENCPLVVDTTGVWFRPEGAKQFICGFSPHSDPDDRPLEVDYTHWDETLWPDLAARVPAFEEAKMTGAWAGYYEFNTFDHNGIIGPHDAHDNLVFATGFSGHGMMQSPGVGVCVAEIICLGEARTIDVEALGWARVEAGTPVFERNVI